MCHLLGCPFALSRPPAPLRMSPQGEGSGSAARRTLARLGEASVFIPGHKLGSSSGRPRLFRERQGGVCHLWRRGDEATPSFPGSCEHGPQNRPGGRGAVRGTPGSLAIWLETEAASRGVGGDAMSSPHPSPSPSSPPAWLSQYPPNRSPDLTVLPSRTAPCRWGWRARPGGATLLPESGGPLNLRPTPTRPGK